MKKKKWGRKFSIKNTIKKVTLGGGGGMFEDFCYLNYVRGGLLAYLGAKENFLLPVHRCTQGGGLRGKGEGKYETPLGVFQKTCQ
jgi:hypothetical protein